MIALLLAAQLTATVQASPAAFQIRPARTFVSSPTLCDANRAVQTADVSPVLLLRPQDRAKIRFHRLGDLPKANREEAVMRTVGGCPVPVAIAYQVEGDGSFANGH